MCKISYYNRGKKRKQKMAVVGGGVGFSKNVDVSVEGEKPKDHFNQKA